jgi:hypothetical protein
MDERATADRIAVYLDRIAAEQMGLRHNQRLAEASKNTAETLVALPPEFETHWSYLTWSAVPRSSADGYADSSATLHFTTIVCEEFMPRVVYLTTGAMPSLVVSWKIDISPETELR